MKKGDGMKKLIFAGLCSGVFLLSSCGNAKDEASSSDVPKALEVKLTGPEEVQPNEKAAYQAAVVYGDEPVTDADEVEFEVWKEGEKSSSSQFKASKKEKGVYRFETDFKDDGLYIVQSHVTAKQQHSMPTIQVRVGDAETDSSSSGKETDEHSHHH